MDQDGKPMAELDDESFLNDLAFLADVTEHMDQLNTKLQSANQTVSHMSHVYVRAFVRKLLMFCSQLEKFDFTHFPFMLILSLYSTEAYVSGITDFKISSLAHLNLVFLQSPYLFLLSIPMLLCKWN